MLKKQNILDLLKGDFTPLTESISEKAESVVADLVVDLSEALLAEMTPGHKAMMKQHLDNVDIEDDTDELTGAPTKPKKRNDARIKNIKRPDDRDAYNQLNDFAASKSGKNTNFVGKTYTTNERALRSEAVEPLEELSKATLGSYLKKASHDLATKSAATGRYGDRANRVRDEIKNKNYANYQQGEKDSKLADKFFEKSWKRRQNMAKAVDKLTKEEIEPLEELSQEKLSKYKGDAEGQILAYDGKSQNNNKKFYNRVRGLNTLARKKKLSKD
jgi:hypothetical protein